MKKTGFIFVLLAALALRAFAMDTVSTEDGLKPKAVMNYWYSTWHYEATKGTQWVNPADENCKYKYVTITVEKKKTKGKVYTATRDMNDTQCTITYQTPKGKVTEVYSNEKADGAYELDPSSNLTLYRDVRKAKLNEIR